MKEYMHFFESCRYVFHSANNILEEKDIGICANIASILTPERSVAAMNGFQACPYTNTAFQFDVKTDGNTVRCDMWTWLPNAILRSGKTKEYTVQTLTAVVPDSRTVVQKLTVTNTTQQELHMPIVLMYRGKTRKEETWAFAIPKADKDNRSNYTMQPDGHMLSSVADGAAYRLTCSLNGMTLFARAYLWETEITVQWPKQSSTL